MENMIFIKLEEYEEMKNKIFIQMQKDMEEFKKSCELEQRINKAIEYIEKHKEPLHHSFDEPDCDYWIATNPDDLLNILKGEEQ